LIGAEHQDREIASLPIALDERLCWITEFVSRNIVDDYRETSTTLGSAIKVRCVEIFGIEPPFLAEHGAQQNSGQICLPRVAFAIKDPAGRISLKVKLVLQCRSPGQTNERCGEKPGQDAL
jgi:hypothetical protein